MIEEDWRRFIVCNGDDSSPASIEQEGPSALFEVGRVSSCHLPAVMVLGATTKREEVDTWTRRPLVGMSCVLREAGCGGLAKDHGRITRDTSGANLTIPFKGIGSCGIGFPDESLCGCALW